MGERMAPPVASGWSLLFGCVGRLGSGPEAGSTPSTGGSGPEARATPGRAARFAFGCGARKCLWDKGEKKREKSRRACASERVCAPAGDLTRENRGGVLRVGAPTRTNRVGGTTSPETLQGRRGTRPILRSRSSDGFAVASRRTRGLFVKTVEEYTAYASRRGCSGLFAFRSIARRL